MQKKTSATPLLCAAVLVLGNLNPCTVSTAKGQESTPEVSGAPNDAAAPTRKFEQRLKEMLSYQPAAGPWGNLAATVFVLEPPDRAVAKIVDDQSFQESPAWVFKGSMADVLKMLAAFGINEETAAELRQQGKIKETADGVVVRPTDQFLLGLSAPQREELYPYIAPFEKANAFHNPYVLDPDGFRFLATISPAGLSESAIQRIDGLVYQRRGKGRYFSDLGSVFQAAETRAERIRIYKTLNRQFSLRLQVHVCPEDDLHSLVAYWAGNGRNKEVLPLLESVAETEGVEMLDVVHLLPPVPRELLNAYPLSGMSVGNEPPDCFSTSMSFFAGDPPTRYLNAIWHVLDARYEKARQPWQFGDLILMRDPDTDEVVHACNYIAADVVFSKNGSSPLRPWVLARIGDVMTEYLTHQRLAASFYRLKPEFRQ